ncbi:hypothetical protein LAZ67_3001304 [Cordylochernes scorpioides]|uniref:Uncharacterized protein n=1 Tax=Cordylochernes scorpioides TaxID=51811 RepID=A0ABY6KA89_9ARAC|nr:hypothetical protein LAZ67_3001304 [Cordylochernes scorpioides]
MGHNCEVVVINEGAEDRALSVVEGTAPRLMLAVEVSKDEYIGESQSVDVQVHQVGVCWQQGAPVHHSIR